MRTNQWLSILLTFALLAACGAKDDVGSGGPTANRLPYAVGSTARFIHDSSRPYDAVAGVDFGVRTLITEIWYPVDHEAVDASPRSLTRAIYGDYVFRNAAMHELMMTKTTFFHLTPESVRDGVTAEQIDAAIRELFGRERDSYVDAPLSSKLDALPVVVMSHGDAGSRYNMESACEYLAAHGYLVIAPEHAGNSPYSMSGSDPALADDGDVEFREAMSGVLPLLSEHGAYGDVEKYGQSYTPLSTGEDTLGALRLLDASLLQRLNDLRATLAELDRMQAAGKFAKRLDLDRVGLMGRSFGGATTLLGLSMEPRFSAGIAVVPPAWPDPRAALPQDVLVDDRESVLLSASGEFPLTSINKPTLLLSGAEDGLIIGFGAQMSAAAGTSMPSASNPHPLLRKMYESTELPVAWGLLADSNHGSFGVSGPYWWPELKPNSASRYFDPNTQFTLIAPQRAHEIQKVKALAFFDLTIRQDAGAKRRLLDQHYSADGLIFEARNL